MDLSELSETIVLYIESQGIMAPVYYVFFLALWVTLLLPCSILEIVPGYLFGFKTGWLVAVLGKSLGTLISVIIGKYFLKEFLQEKIISRYPVMTAFNKAIEQDGFKMIMLIRATYLPMIIKNYGLGVLDIPVYKIVSASLLVGIPFSAMWAAIGTSSKSMTDIMAGKSRITDILPEENREILVACGFFIGVIFLSVLRSFSKKFNKILSEIREKQD